MFSTFGEGKVENSWQNYYSGMTATEDEDRRGTPGVINAFYNLATDFYEYGWGQSFHFAHTKTSESHDDSIRRHEERIADEIGLKPGLTALDVGCGVGGPARAIAKHSGGNVQGITINEYQVNKANNYAKEMGLDKQVHVVQGDFLNMPFEPATFDLAYAIEATCHAPALEMVYGEVFKALKPGGKFASYEWLTTSEYDASNPAHVEAIHEIEYGNALPPIRSPEEVIAAAQAVGFKVLYNEDLAQDTVDTRPWYSRLDMSWISYKFTHFTCVVTETLGLSPKGTTETHEMLLTAVDGLVAGGKLNVFTPMHLFVFEKPE